MRCNKWDCKKVTWPDGLVVTTMATILSCCCRFYQLHGRFKKKKLLLFKMLCTLWKECKRRKKGSTISEAKHIKLLICEGVIEYDWMQSIPAPIMPGSFQMQWFHRVCYEGAFSTSLSWLELNWPFVITLSLWILLALKTLIREVLTPPAHFLLEKKKKQQTRVEPLLIGNWIINW